MRSVDFVENYIEKGRGSVYEHEIRGWAQEDVTKS